MSKIDMSWIPAGIWNEDMRARTPCCLLRSDNGPSKDDSSEDSGLSELEVPEIPGPPQILVYLKLGWVTYAHQITTGTPGFSDLPTALY